MESYLRFIGTLLGSDLRFIGIPLESNLRFIGILFGFDLNFIGFLFESEVPEKLLKGKVYFHFEGDRADFSLSEKLWGKTEKCLNY